MTLAAGLPYLIPHHFDMFAFNTLDPALIDAAAAGQMAGQTCVFRPHPGETLAFFP